MTTAQTETSLPYASKREPVLVTVKYRDTLVNVAAAGFTALARTDGDVLRRAWYDAPARYLVVDLGGALYHYCACAPRDWDSLEQSADLDDHYTNAIKGRFDCRTVGIVPDYGRAATPALPPDFSSDGRSSGCEIEDRHHMRAGTTAPRVLTTIRNTAISLLRLAGATNITATCDRSPATPPVPLHSQGHNPLPAPTVPGPSPQRAPQPPNAVPARSTPTPTTATTEPHRGIIGSPTHKTRGYGVDTPMTIKNHAKPRHRHHAVLVAASAYGCLATTPDDTSQNVSPGQLRYEASP